MESTESTGSDVSSRTDSTSARQHWRRNAVLLCAVMILIVLGTLHWFTTEIDPAIVNVATGLSSIILWICLWTSLQLSPLPRIVWRLAAAVPLAICLVLWGMYKMERLDGELVPQFRLRWSPTATLPASQLTGAAISPEWLLALPTDFPQFLGPSRNGVLDSVRLQSDWKANPPKVMWKLPIGDGWSGFAVQGNVAITMEQRDAQEWVTAYAVPTGEILWHYGIDGVHTNVLGGTGPRSTPTISNGKVYACSAVSRIVCLDLANGEEVWHQDLLELADTTQAEFESAVSWGRSASPLLWNGLAITSLGGAGSQESLRTLIAFDAATGEERWRAGEQQISYASPVMLNILGNEQLAIIGEQALVAFDPTNQRPLWSVDWPGSSHGAATVSQPIQASENTILMSKGYGEGCQLLSITELANGQWKADILWKNSSSLNTKFNSAVVHAGFAYGLSNGILECIDLADGKRRWKKGRYQQGQVLLVGELLLITSERGEIVLVTASPDQFQELALLDVIGDVTWNTAALSGDRLLIRNSDEAACIQLPIVATPTTSSVAAPIQDSADGH